ncbi:hypothetical protein CNR22_23465 [Sphingobacteriaceae bacterium]|nr:hypothetical protein CNR22_23465 [Sphingobacteriaceae bacterium]
MRIGLSILLLLIIRISVAQEVKDTLESFVEGREDTTTIKVLRLKLNSDKPDFSPFFVNNELFFVSGRNKEVGVDYVDANGESEITDLYRSTRVSPVKFRNTRTFDSRINSKAYEGPFCINKQGTIIYFTANDKKTAALKIFRSEKTENKWSRPEQLSFCKDTFSYFHPALSPMEDQLIFASDRNRAKNKIDLYASSLQGDSWSEPQALNALINDTNSQVFPFIGPNNVLYFSCDKKTGTGMDIYFVSLDSAKKEPRLLTFPINTKYDDFGIWVDSASSSGYFSSNRIAKFKDDIYYFTNSMPDFRDAKTVIPKTQFCYSFVEESTLASKDTLTLTYEWDFGDGKKSRGLRARHCFPGPGEYQVVLNVVDKMSGEIFISETSYPLTIERPTNLVISCSEKASINEEIVLMSKDLYIKNCKPDKICWAFGDGRFNSGSTVKHRYKKPGTYKIQLGVVAKNKDTEKMELYKIEKTIIVSENVK